MSKSIEEEKKAVAAGYWSNYRYNPELAKEGKNPFIYETKDPKEDMMDFLKGEVRYKALTKQFPDAAKDLFKRAVQFRKEKHEFYKKYSEM
jgi:pyruvate-ferredoxin/flavodoxin oxidoreductase